MVVRKTRKAERKRKKETKGRGKETNTVQNKGKNEMKERTDREL
jgi:hypothetical protein